MPSVHLGQVAERLWTVALDAKQRRVEAPAKGVAE